jgi:hypothetical protein
MMMAERIREGLHMIPTRYPALSRMYIFPHGVAGDIAALPWMTIFPVHRVAGPS